MRTLRLINRAWVFPLAVALHNSEEAVLLPGWASAHSIALPFQPSPGRIRSGLLLVTAAAILVSLKAARSGKQSTGAYLLFGFEATMLANVFIPHVPATLLLRQYTPGVVSAVLINLPVMSILMRDAVREGWVAGKRALAVALIVPLASAAAIAAYLSLPSPW